MDELYLHSFIKPELLPPVSDRASCAQAIGLIYDITVDTRQHGILLLEERIPSLRLGISDRTDQFFQRVLSWIVSGIYPDLIKENCLSFLISQNLTPMEYLAVIVVSLGADAIQCGLQPKIIAEKLICWIGFEHAETIWAKIKEDAVDERLIHEKYQNLVNESDFTVPEATLWDMLIDSLDHDGLSALIDKISMMELDILLVNSRRKTIESIFAIFSSAMKTNIIISLESELKMHKYYASHPDSNVIYLRRDFNEILMGVGKVAYTLIDDGKIICYSQDVEKELQKLTLQDSVNHDTIIEIDEQRQLIQNNTALERQLR